jgi:hypothetical protein
MFAKCASLVGLLLTVSTVASAQTFRCDINHKMVCQQSGCKAVPASVWNIIQLDKKTYARCDAKSCDTYNAQFSEGGAFLNIQVTPSTIAKMAVADVPVMELKKFSFHEVATQLHDVYVSFGACRPN